MDAQGIIVYIMIKKYKDLYYMANRIILSNNRNDRKIQARESIVLNAYTNQSGVVTGGAKDQSGCYITPIRDISGEGFAKVLYYDPATFEVGYADSGDEGGTVTSVGISSATLGISGVNPYRWQWNYYY